MLLRRTPTQTATRHSDSLHVHKLVFCGLLMILSATSHGDFPINVVGSMLPVCALRSRPFQLGTGGLRTQKLCQVV